MAMESFVVAVNPGSASRKYGFYKKNRLIADVHFEHEANGITCTIKNDKKSVTVPKSVTDLTQCPAVLLSLLQDKGFITTQNVSAIGIRIVAPTSFFLKNRFIDEKAIAELKALQRKSPLHITTTLQEILELQKIFPDVPVYGVSDSAFHADKPDHAWNYGISLELADAYEIKRFGYHGISVESVIQKIAAIAALEQKVIVCHLGSGSSVTAVLDGVSVETTMGYSPLEGLVMATRSGSIDFAAATELKVEQGITDAELEEQLLKQSGLLGISGISNDIRELLVHEAKGNYRAALALKMYVYGVQKAIGQMSAVLNGVDALVFTGTVGVRSAIIRERIITGLEYLNLTCNGLVNDTVYEPDAPSKINPRTRQKNIFVVTTDEAYEIAWRTAKVTNL